MSAEQRVVGSLRVVASRNVNSSWQEKDFYRQGSGRHELSRDQVLDYLAQMSSEMHALAKTHNYVIIAHLFEIAAREAEEIQQRAAGD